MYFFNMMNMMNGNKLVCCMVIYVALTMLACKQIDKPQPLTTIEFEKVEFDMGMLENKKSKAVDIGFVNNGNEPLVIHRVEASCGCTVPQWPPKPIAPSKKGRIGVTYDAEFPGMFRKEIIVHYNGVNLPDTLVIRGEVDMGDVGFD
jgi:hypothetical protein